MICSWKTTTPYVSRSASARCSCGKRTGARPCRASMNGRTMSAATGPGRNSEMSTTRSWKVDGWSRPTRSRWPGDSIWKQPSVSAERISSYVAPSPGGTCAGSSRSSSSPVPRRISATACAIADCMRTPSTSSLSSPRSSTSSLSNWDIGNPSPLVGTTGVRASSEASESSTPHGCMAIPRGSASSASTSSHSRPCSSPRTSRSSGSSARAVRASRARMCGKALASRSTVAGSMDRAAPTSRIACRTR